MQITVSGRHGDVDVDLRGHIEERARKLSRFYDRIQSVDVIVDEQSGAHVVEMIARADHHTTFIAKHNDRDAYVTVDQVAKEIEGQLRRHKERFRNRKHLVGPADKQALGEPAGLDETSGNEPHEVD